MARKTSIEGLKSGTGSGSETPNQQMEPPKKARSGSASHYLIDLESKQQQPPPPQPFDTDEEDNDSGKMDSDGRMANPFSGEMNKNPNYQDLYFKLLEKYQKFERVLNKSNEFKMAHRSGKLNI